MKEENTKKNLKISLSTFFLIIAIIVIIVMGYYLYITIEGKRDEEKQVSDLENEINILENTVNTLQQQVSEKSNTSNTVNTNTVQTNNSTTNEEKQFSNEEIKKALQEYLNLAGVSEGGPSALLQKLNLIDIANEVIRDDGYVKTNIQYDDYKNAMLNYVTEDWFENRFSGGFKNENGILCYNAGGGTGMEFEVESINIKGEYSDSAYIGNVYNIALDGSKTIENIEFHIANENGKCVISYCD